jgi:hypothetical protein
MMKRVTTEQKKSFRLLRHEGMKCLSEFTTSANGRNYVLTQYLEDIGDIQLDITFEDRKFVLLMVPLEEIFDMLPTRLIVERPDLVDMHARYVFGFKDIKSVARLEVRDRVLEVMDWDYTQRDRNSTESEFVAYLQEKYVKSDKNDHVVLMTSQGYRELVLYNNGAKQYALGHMKLLKGSLLSLYTFGQWFEQE